MSKPGENSPADEEHPVVEMLQQATPEVIRQRFALKFGLVLLVMALSIGAIGYIATQAVTGETEENVEAEFLADAGQQADIVEQWLESNARQVEIQSDKGEYHEDIDSVSLEIEGDLARATGDVHEIHVLDDDEELGFRVFESTSSGVESGTALSDFGEREWLIETGEFIEILELGTDDVYISDTYEADGRYLVAFISPSSVDGDRYLFTEVDVVQLQNSLRGAIPEEDIGFSQVVLNGAYQGDTDRQHLVMIDARPGSERVLQTYAEDEDTLRPLRLANETGVITEMAANEDVLDEVYTVGYSPVTHQDSDWVVLVHGPRSDVFGFVDTLGTWGIIMTLLSVLLIGVTGAVLGYSTSTSIDRLTSKTDEMREGNLDVTLHTSRVDDIGQLYDGFADMRDALKTQIEESERARKEAEVARREAEQMAEYLQETAEAYSDVMQQVSAGDLTQRMSKDGQEESMDRIAEEFNGMVEELEKTTGQLKDYVDEVEEAGAEVEESAATVRSASEQVAESVQKISDDAYDQKERLENIATTMDDITERLDSYADSEDVDIDEPLAQIESIAEDVNDIARLTEETMSESEHVAGAAEEQAAELNEVSERAHDLQRYAQPLRDILQRFETEEKHEFVFSVGPTGGAASPGSRRDGDDGESESESAE